MLKSLYHLLFLSSISNASQIPLSAPAPSSPHHAVDLNLDFNLNLNLGSNLDFNATIKAFLTNYSIPALSLAITKNGRLVYASAHGNASIEPLEPATPSHRFRQASVSKTITAIAIFHLLQTGEVHLSSLVFGDAGILGHEYGSKPYSNSTELITVRHLLDHSSVFLDEEMCGKGCDPTYLPQFLELDQWDLVPALLDEYEGPGHEPGTVASYSNFGYFVLGRIVEAVVSRRGGAGTGDVGRGSGVKGVLYEDVVKYEVLSKVGVHGMEIANDERRDLEVGYYEDDPEAPYSFHVSRRDAVGAWIATPTDLVRVLTSIDGSSGRWNSLNSTTRDLVFEKSEVEGSEYGLGWDEVIQDEEGRTVKVAKSGGYAGTSSWVVIDLVQNITFAVTINKHVASEPRALKTLVEDLLEQVHV